MSDYNDRTYLSAREVSSYLGIRVREVHELIKENILPALVSGGGQYRIDLACVKKIEAEYREKKGRKEAKRINDRKKRNRTKGFCWQCSGYGQSE